MEGETEATASRGTGKGKGCSRKSFFLTLDKSSDKKKKPFQKVPADLVAGQYQDPFCMAHTGNPEQVSWASNV